MRSLRVMRKRTKLRENFLTAQPVVVSYSPPFLIPSVSASTFEEKPELSFLRQIKAYQLQRISLSDKYRRTPIPTSSDYQRCFARN